MDLLDLVLLYDCNLKCTYCTISDDMRQRVGVSTDLARRHIDEAAGRGCRSLSLTGGEPTLRRDLLALIRHARRRGFTDIKVQTNGLLFAEAANLDRAVAAGLTRVGVSVHGYSPTSPAAYEASVRAGGSQALLLRAIDHLLAAPVALTVDLILMTSTLPTVFEALRDLHARGVTAFNLWLVSLTDANAEAVDSLPRLTDAVPVVTRCFDYGREHGLDVRSLHIPRCLLPGYEAHVDHPGVGKHIRVVSPDAVFELSASALSGGVKPPRCDVCRWAPVCPGLRADYVSRFGDAELQPQS